MCKGWLLVSRAQWLPWHISESDGKNILAIAMEKCIVSTFAWKIFGHSNGKRHCVHFCMKKGIVSIFTCHIMETSHSQKNVMSCHVQFLTCHICTFAHLGKWTTKRQIGNQLPREKWKVISLSFVFVIWKSSFVFVFVFVFLFVNFFCSCHVFSSLWTNVSKVTSL